MKSEGELKGTSELRNSFNSNTILSALIIEDFIKCKRLQISQTFIGV